MRENQGPPRVGRDVHVAHERTVMARARSVASTCIRPVFVNGDRVVIRWRFELDYADGRRTSLDEIAWQRWSGDLIAEERFYYDPAQHKDSRAG